MTTPTPPLNADMVARLQHALLMMRTETLTKGVFMTDLITYQNRTDTAGREEIALCLQEAVRLEGEAQPFITPVVEDHFWGRSGILLMGVAQSPIQEEKAYQWFVKGLSVCVDPDRRAAYIEDIFEIIIKKDDPAMFKRWAVACQQDLLSPYIKACQMGSLNIIQAFAPSQGKRLNNKAFKEVIDHSNLQAFEAMLPHVNPRKSDSIILTGVINALYLLEVNAKGVMTNIKAPYHYDAKIKKQQLRYNFLNKILPVLWEKCDPVKALEHISTKPLSRLQKNNEMIAEKFTPRQISRATKIRKLRDHYPIIEGWHKRQTLATVAKQASSQTTRAHKPKL